MLNFFGFQIPILYVHLGTLVCIVPLVAFSDFQALLWKTGKKETLNPKVIKTLHNLTGIALVTMILSGIAMSMSIFPYLFAEPAFLVKMIFVLALVVNSFFIGKLMHITFERSYASLSVKEKTPLLIAGAVSGIGWVGAFISALLMGFGDIAAILHL